MPWNENLDTVSKSKFNCSEIYAHSIMPVTLKVVKIIGIPNENMYINLLYH